MVDYQAKLKSLEEANARLHKRLEEARGTSSRNAARASLALAGISDPALVEDLSPAIMGLDEEKMAEKASFFASRFSAAQPAPAQKETPDPESAPQQAAPPPPVTTTPPAASEPQPAPRELTRRERQLQVAREARERAMRR